MNDACLFECIHELGNDDDSGVAVTLHFFTPPFVQMGYVDSNGLDRVVPIIHSAKSTEMFSGLDPVTSCDDAIHRERQLEKINDDGYTPVEEIVKSGDVASDEISCVFEQAEDNQIFSNLYAFIRFVSRFDVISSCLCQHIVMTLNCININEDEWSLLISADPLSENSRLIGRGHNFSVWLRRWNAGEKGHDLFQKRHWLKILRGELVASLFLNEIQIMSGSVTVRNGIFLGGGAKCELFNSSNVRSCFALIIAEE